MIVGDFFIKIGVFIFGLIIGSFLNVVILRKERKSLMGYSECPNCKKRLKFYQLIPIISFLLQKGRCSSCSSKISWQYPLVELSTALLFLFSFCYYFIPVYTYLSFDLIKIFDIFSLFTIISLLIIIFVYDFYYKIIPDFWNFSFAGVALLRMFVLNFDGFAWNSFFWSAFILATPFAFLWFISEGRWIGLGDAKLALGIGWFLGLVEGSSAIILGVWIGALFSLFLIFLSRFTKLQELLFLKNNLTIKSEVPFAPFLIIGILLVFFFSWDVWGLGLLI